MNFIYVVFIYKIGRFTDIKDHMWLSYSNFVGNAEV